MLEIMYEVPSLNNVKSCLITKEVILKTGKPKYTFKGGRKTTEKPAPRKKEITKEIA